MTGTDKQIKWANDIKSTILNGAHQAFNDGMYNNAAKRKRAISQREDKIAAGRWDGDALEKRTANLVIKKQELGILKTAIAFVEACNDSSWFIDNRDQLLNFIPMHEDMRMFNSLFVAR